VDLRGFFTTPTVTGADRWLGASAPARPLLRRMRPKEDDD
jgi:hypothetical protein